MKKLSFLLIIFFYIGCSSESKRLDREINENLIRESLIANVFSEIHEKYYFKVSYKNSNVNLPEAHFYSRVGKNAYAVLRITLDKHFKTISNDFSWQLFVVDSISKSVGNGMSLSYRKNQPILDYSDIQNIISSGGYEQIYLENSEHDFTELLDEYLGRQGGNGVAHVGNRHRGQL